MEEIEKVVETIKALEEIEEGSGEEIQKKLSEAEKAIKDLKKLGKSLKKDKKINSKEDKKKAEKEKWEEVIQYVKRYKELCADVIKKLEEALVAKRNLNRARSSNLDLTTYTENVGKKLNELEQKEEELRVMKRGLKEDKLNLGLEKIFKRALKIKTN